MTASGRQLLLRPYRLEAAQSRTAVVDNGLPREHPMELIDFPDEQGGETVSINPALVTHVIEVGRGNDKYTEIFVVGGAKVTVHAAANDVKTKLTARSG
jgi:hypothetical protein